MGNLIVAASHAVAGVLFLTGVESGGYRFLGISTIWA